MKPVQDTQGPKVLVKGEMVVVVPQVGRQVGYVVAGVADHRAELEEQKGIHGLRPVVPDEHGSDQVGQQVGDKVLGHGAVRRGQADGRGELVVLLVEPFVEALGVQRPVGVVEADFRAEQIKDHGRHRFRTRRELGCRYWFARANRGRQIREGQCDEQQVPQSNGRDATVLAQADSRERLYFVLEQPRRPPCQIWNRKYGGPGPVKSRRDDECPPKVDIKFPVCLVEVIVEVLPGCRRVEDDKRAHPNQIDKQRTVFGVGQRRGGICPSFLLGDDLPIQVSRYEYLAARLGFAYATLGCVSRLVRRHCDWNYVSSFL